MNELQQQNNRNLPGSTNCGTAHAELMSLKSELKTMRVTIDKIVSAIDKLTIDSTELKTKQAFIINDVDNLKKFIDNAKVISESIITLKDAFNKLDRSLTTHSDVATKTFSKLNHDVSEIKMQLHNLPMLYVAKSSKSLSEVIKLAPGIIAIISVILSALVLYLKGAL